MVFVVVDRRGSTGLDAPAADAPVKVYGQVLLFRAKLQIASGTGSGESAVARDERDRSICGPLRWRAIWFVWRSVCGFG